MQGDADKFLIDPEDQADVEDRPALNPARPLWPLRREMACLNLFSGMNQSEAYVAAGFKDASVACRFFKNEDVYARLMWMAEAEFERVRADVARARCAVIYADALAMAEAEEVRIMAMKLNRPGAALGAVVLKARLAGLLKHDDDGLNLPLGDMTLDQVEKYRDYFGRRLNAIDTAIAEHESRGPDKTPDDHPGSLPNTRH